MRAELANLSHCAVTFLSRAVVNLSWYDIISFYSDGNSMECCVKGEIPKNGKRDCGQGK